MTIEQAHEDDYQAVLGRVKRTALGAVFVFGIGLVLWRGWWSLVGLTCSAAVVMINFLWLEEIVQKTLQAAPEVESWKLILWVLVRFHFLVGALVVAVVVARFEPLSVILGFSIIVVGVMGEAAYSVVQSLREAGLGRD